MKKCTPTKFFYFGFGVGKLNFTKCQKKGRDQFRHLHSTQIYTATEGLSFQPLEALRILGKGGMENSKSRKDQTMQDNRVFEKG